MHVVERLLLPTPRALVWEQLADLSWLATVNLFHQRAQFVSAQQRGIGTRLIVDHGLTLGPRMPRLVRVTHWDEGRRIRWTDVDPAYPTYRFPHAEQFILADADGAATWLTDELTGTLNLPDRSDEPSSTR